MGKGLPHTLLPTPSSESREKGEGVGKGPPHTLPGVYLFIFFIVNHVGIIIGISKDVSSAVLESL